MLFQCFCLCTCCSCVESSSAKQSSCEHPVMCQNKGTVSGSRQMTGLRAGIKFYFFCKVSYIIFSRHLFLRLVVHYTEIAPASCWLSKLGPARRAPLFIILYLNMQAMDHLESFIAECDRRTELAKKRLAETQEEISAEVSAKVLSSH